MIQKNPMNMKLVERQRILLFSVIADYTSTGRPVSSKSLAKKHALSSASIRRILHELTIAGFLVQPHTSAGRIPTDRAFRLFVDALRQSFTDIDANTKEVLSSTVRDLVPAETESWRETVRVLSNLTTQTALVITPAVSDSILKQLRFISMGPKDLLAVVVTREGIVYNASLQSKVSISDSELEQVHNYLNELIKNRTLNEVRLLLREEMEDARKKCDLLRTKAVELGQEALKSSDHSGSKLLVEGRSKLLDQPELEDNLHELLVTLEEKGRILELLDRAAESDKGPLVIIGQEGGVNFDGCSLVSSPFGKNGFVGVVGSTRMDYHTMIPLVSLSARLLSLTFKNNM